MKESDEAKQKLNELCSSNALDLIEKRERLESIIADYGGLDKKKLWIEPEGIDALNLDEGPAIVFQGFYDYLEFIGLYVQEDSFYLITSPSYFRKDYGLEPYVRLNKAFTNILGHEETGFVIDSERTLITKWEEYL